MHTPIHIFLEDTFLAEFAVHGRRSGGWVGKRKRGWIMDHLAVWCTEMLEVEVYSKIIILSHPTCTSRCSSCTIALATLHFTTL